MRNSTPWISAGALEAFPLPGQLVMICGPTFRAAPYATYYQLARYIGLRESPWRAMDGITIREPIAYWRELAPDELPNDL